MQPVNARKESRLSSYSEWKARCGLPAFTGAALVLDVSMRTRGGRLILYHGWNDLAISASGTIAYYRACREKHRQANQNAGEEASCSSLRHPSRLPLAS